MMNLFRCMCLFAVLRCAAAQKIDSNLFLSSAESLRGLTGFSVIATSDSGEDSFRIQIIQALRDHGVAILPSGTYPRLALNIVTASLTVNTSNGTRFGTPILYTAYTVQLDIQQAPPAGAKYLLVNTNSQLRMGLAGGFVLAKSIRDAVDGTLNDFFKEYDQVNQRAKPLVIQGAGPAPSGAAQASSSPFLGIWDGKYSCPNGGGGTTTWRITEGEPGEFLVDEQWVHIISGRNRYHGTISGGTLNVQTIDLGHYSVKLTLSEDKSVLHGAYSGHPNRCESLTLTKLTK